MGHWDGIDGDVITDGMSFDGEIGFGLEDALWPDLNARPILAYGEDGDGLWPALRYADEAQRLVFTTVPWEELPIFEPGEDGDSINPDPNNSAYFLTNPSSAPLAAQNDGFLTQLGVRYMEVVSLYSSL